jgi:hypothetical protein
MTPGPAGPLSEAGLLPARPAAAAAPPPASEPATSATSAAPVGTNCP